MSDFGVSTEKILDIAHRLKSINDDQHGAVVHLGSAVNEMDSEWDGAAAQYAIEQYNSLLAKHEARRFDVMNELAKFVENTVIPGASEVESENTALADHFK